MSDIAIESQGTTIGFGSTGSPNDFTTIPEVKSIGGPDGQAAWIDTTDLSSTGKEGRPGLKDEGQIRIRIFYVPSNAVHAAIRAAYSARTQKAIQITFTDGTVWEANVYVTAFQSSNEVDGATQADVTFKITGAISQVH